MNNNLSGDQLTARILTACTKTSNWEGFKKISSSLFRGGAANANVWCLEPSQIQRMVEIEPQIIFDRYDIDREAWERDGNILVEGLFADIFEELNEEIEYEFNLYLHHRPPVGTDNQGHRGWMRHMLYSLTQQLVRQDVEYYSLIVATRPDKQHRLITYPYYTKYTQPGDSLGFKHLDLNAEAYAQHRQGDTWIQSLVSLDDETPDSCTVLVPGFHHVLEQWWDVHSKRREAQRRKLAGSQPPRANDITRSRPEGTQPTRTQFTGQDTRRDPTRLPLQKNPRGPSKQPVNPKSSSRTTRTASAGQDTRQDSTRLSVHHKTPGRTQQPVDPTSASVTLPGQGVARGTRSSTSTSSSSEGSSSQKTSARRSSHPATQNHLIESDEHPTSPNRIPQARGRVALKVPEPSGGLNTPVSADSTSSSARPPYTKTSRRLNARPNGDRTSFVAHQSRTTSDSSDSSNLVSVDSDTHRGRSERREFEASKTSSGASMWGEGVQPEPPQASTRGQAEPGSHEVSVSPPPTSDSAMRHIVVKHHTTNMNQCYTKEDEKSFGAFVPIVAKRGDVRITHPAIVHGSSSGKNALPRRAVFGWHVGIGEDHQQLDNPQSESWTELRLCHLDLLPASLSPSGRPNVYGSAGNSHAAIETRLPASTCIGDALTGGRRWDDTAVVAELNIVFGEDEEAARAFLIKARSRAIQSFKTLFKVVKQSEGELYGHESFNRFVRDEFTCGRREKVSEETDMCSDENENSSEDEEETTMQVENGQGDQDDEDLGAPESQLASSDDDEVHEAGDDSEDSDNSDSEED